MVVAAFNCSTSICAPITFVTPLLTKGENGVGKNLQIVYNYCFPCGSLCWLSKLCQLYLQNIYNSLVWDASFKYVF